MLYCATSRKVANIAHTHWRLMPESLNNPPHTPESIDRIKGGCFDLSPDSVFVVNRQGNIVAANLEAERVLGYSESELLHNSIDILLPEGSRKGHAERREEFLKNPQKRPLAIGLDFVAETKTGRHVPVEVSLAPCVDNGRGYVVAFVRDISRSKIAESGLKEQNERLARANRDLQLVVYAASHDLIEPVRSAVIAAQMLNRFKPNSTDGDAKIYYEQLLNESLRAKAMLDALGKYCQITHDSAAVTELNLSEIVDALLAEHFRSERLGKYVKIHCEPLPRVRGIGTHIKRLLFELLDNAIKFRKQEPGDVRIAYQDLGNEHRISVSDNGVGVDEQHRSKIFDLFRQVHGPRSYPGVGLGLAIAKKIVENHGGRIWADCSALGGATILFSLPK